MAIGDPYVTREEFKSALEIDQTDQDDWIDRCLLAAANSINRRSGWGTFWNTETAVTRTEDLSGRVAPVRRYGCTQYKVLLREGIASAVGFSVSGYSSASIMPPDALDRGLAADAILLGTSAPSGTLTFTAVRGWPVEPPADIVWANQMQAHRFFRRKGSPEGVAGSAEWGLTRVPRLDPDVLGILKDGGYMRPGIG